jgi:hypothetical protein
MTEPPPPPLPPQASPPQAPQNKRGCLFYGCITLAVVVLLAGIGTWVAVRYAMKTAGGLIDQYTSTNAIPIESVSISQSDLKSLQDRLTSFSEALEGRPGSRELVLNAHEINALIQNAPEYAELKNKLFIMIEDDEIKGKLSMPLDNLGPLKLKGRYLNGIATLQVDLENGALDVKLKDVRVGDNQLPAPILSELKKANFSQEFQKDPEARRTIEKLESIKVKNGTVVIRAKQAEKP